VTVALATVSSGCRAVVLKWCSMSVDESQVGSTFTCAVCYEELATENKLYMPCCGLESSTIEYCMYCIALIAQNGLQSYIGRCPSCRAYYRMKSSSEVELITQVPAQCFMCYQIKTIVDPRRNLCAACTLGSTYSFRYECDGCHCIQRIPHPMWQYQRSPTDFGDVTWACHQRCGSFTHWRIIHEDLSRIPPDHTPDSWGLREVWLERIRELRRQQSFHPSSQGAMAGDDAELLHVDDATNPRFTCTMS
jgi:hypothetical protein